MAHSDFYELCLPKGSDLHWFVRTELAATQNGKNLWLKNDGTISNNVTNVREFYFDTELDALMEMRDYYGKNRRHFPYHAELIMLMDAESIKILNTIATGSRELEL